jgi:hypothetical protein
LKAASGQEEMYPFKEVLGMRKDNQDQANGKEVELGKV